MAIALQKGVGVSLKKDDGTNLVTGSIQLGWDEGRFKDDVDLDASLFLLGANGKVLKDEDFIFYNNLVHPSGGVTHTGDNRTGGDDEIQEQIDFDLSKLPDYVEKLIVAVTIHEADARNQNFGQVENAFVRVVDEKNSSVAQYDLTEDYSIETSMVFCEIYKHNSEWKVKAIGNGFDNGLEGLCVAYGLQVV